MKQYCRYCVYLYVNNVPYCSKHEKCKSESSCKSANKCKDFELCEAEPEFQDAFGETNGYKPRTTSNHYKQDYDNQMSIFDTESRDCNG